MQTDKPQPNYNEIKKDIQKCQYTLLTCWFVVFLSTSLAFLKVTGTLDESLDLGDTSITAHMHKGKGNDMKNVIMQEELDSSFDL